MLRCVENLIGSIGNKKIGNHRKEVYNNRVDYIYFYTVICSVDNNLNIFYVDNGGWNTSSTNRAIGDYRRFFNGCGYREVSKEEFIKLRA